MNYDLGIANERNGRAISGRRASWVMNAIAKQSPFVDGAYDGFNPRPLACHMPARNYFRGVDALRRLLHPTMRP